MKNKRMLLLCAAALVLILVIVLVAGSRGSKAEESQETAAPVSQNIAQNDLSSGEATANQPEGEQAQPTEEPYVLEDEGELEIIIPEDQDSDGF